MVRSSHQLIIESKLNNFNIQFFRHRQVLNSRSIVHSKLSSLSVGKYLSGIIIIIVFISKKYCSINVSVRHYTKNRINFNPFPKLLLELSGYFRIVRHFVGVPGILVEIPLWDFLKLFGSRTNFHDFC